MSPLSSRLDALDRVTYRLDQTFATGTTRRSSGCATGCA